ncbi:hypothetical protein ABK040_006214 [Willaertia magna]
MSEIQNHLLTNTGNNHFILKTTQNFTETLHFITNSSNEQLVGILRTSNNSNNNNANNNNSSNNMIDNLIDNTNDFMYENIKEINEEKNPIVIFCHGLACHKNYFIFPIFYNKKIDTFRFDFSGNCQSEGEFSYSNYLKEVEDLFSIYNYLKNKLNYKKISIFGHSKGGNIVLLYSNKYPETLQNGIVINCCGRFDMKKTPVSRFTEKEMFELEKNGKFLWKRMEYPSDLLVPLNNIPSSAFSVSYQKTAVNQQINNNVDNNTKNNTTTNNSDNNITTNKEIKEEEQKEENLIKEMYCTKEALIERENISMKINFKKDFPLKIISIHGKKDDIIDCKDSLDFDLYFKEQTKELNNNCDNFSHKVILVEDGDHFFVKQREEIVKIVNDELMNYYYH